MIITKTPMRISFLGGGTDYPSWYLEHGGKVLTTSIDKYVYISYFNGDTKIIHRDLPSKSGLGSSSAETVGKLRAWDIVSDRKIIAFNSINLEQEKLAGNIGAQDQYICALGGFRLIRFSEAGIRDYKFENIDWLNPYLMLFNTHQYRMAGKVVANQLKEMKHHTKVYERMMELVEVGKDCLDRKDYESFGVLLDESWDLKKQLSKYITTSLTDEIYNRAKKAGIIGGKLLGAGGGGFMLFVAPIDKQEFIKESLSDCEYILFKFENSGTQIIFKDNI